VVKLRAKQEELATHLEAAKREARATDTEIKVIIL
jgi:hypothetical protein